MAVGSPKKSKAKKPSSHPTYSVMIATAIKSLKERSGSSRQAILKYIVSHYKVDPVKAGTQLRLALKRSVASGALKQVKGAGASGSFKLPSTEAKPKKKSVKKRSVSKKPKKVVKKVKKAKSPKKPAVKKSPKKVKKAVKKPVAKKTKRSPAKKAKK